MFNQDQLVVAGLKSVRFGAPAARSNDRCSPWCEHGSSASAVQPVRGVGPARMLGTDMNHGHVYLTGEFQHCPTPVHCRIDAGQVVTSLTQRTLSLIHISEPTR